MAEWFEWTGEQKEAWEAWVVSRPESVRILCERLPLNRLYRMHSTGHRVTIIAYNEDGTVRVSITGQYNLIPFDREVFGVEASDLSECDLPTSDEPLGRLLVEKSEIEAFIELLQENLRTEERL